MAIHDEGYALGLITGAFALLLAYLVFVGLITGIGVLALAHSWGAGQRDGLVMFWTGWVMAAAALMAWHLMAPLSGWALIPLVIAGLSGWATRWRPAPLMVDAIRRGGSSGQRSGIATVDVLALLGAGLFVSLLAAQGHAVYDHGLYHAQTVSWWSSHPAVPGLGNLHGRLAFNNSSFALPAALHGLLPISVRHLALGAPATVFVYELIQRVRGRFRRDALVSRWTAVVLLGITVLWLVRTVGSMSPDLAAFLLQGALGLRILDLADLPGLRHRGTFIATAILAAGLVTVKLSAGLFALPAMAIVIVWCSPRVLRGRTGFVSGGLMAAVLIPWLVHGVVQSGYPAYPVPFLGIPVDWQIPASDVRAMSALISSWAWSHLQWYLADWLAWTPALLVVPMFLTWSSPSRREVATIGLLAVSAASVVALSPDPRFVGAVPWLMAGSALGVAARNTGARIGPLQRALPALTAMAMVLLPVSLTMVQLDRVRSVPFPPEPVVPLTHAVIDGGLTVHAPQRGDQAYWAPLPSVPEISGMDDDLRLRAEGDLSSGFRIRR